MICVPTTTEIHNSCPNLLCSVDGSINDTIMPNNQKMIIWDDYIYQFPLVASSVLQYRVAFSV